MELNAEELEKVYNEVAEKIEGDGWADYYTTVCAPVNTEYGSDCITFEAIYNGNREYAYPYTVTWYINSDGSISNSDGERWDSLEQFNEEH